MNIYDCFGYTGGPFQLLKKDTIGFIAGNTICKWNLEKNKKKFIESERNGFQCFASSHRRKILVTAEYGLNPVVSVYMKDKHFQLNGVSPLEILQMEISQCGRYLLVVIGVPKFEIVVWDLVEKEKLQGSQSSLPLKLNFQEARFTVLGERILIKYEKYIQLYHMAPHFESQDQNIVKNIKLELMATYYLDQPTKMVQDYNYVLDSRSSYEENNLYLIQGNTLIYLNGENLQEIARNECQSEIKHLIITQVHLIVVYKNSKFEWLFKYIPTNLQDESVKPFKVDKKFNHSDRGEISYLQYNQYFQRMICGTEDASLLIIQIQAENIQGEDDGQGEPGSEDKVTDLTHEVEAIKLGPFQKGAVTFIKEFSNYSVLVTGCDSGNIVFWDIIDRKPLSSFQVQGSISAGDLQGTNLIVGSQGGVIRFYNVADIRNPVLFKMIKLYIDKPVSQICFNDKMLAVSSVESQQVFFFQQDSMIGFVELPFNCTSICWNQDQQKQILICLSSFLLLSIKAPKQPQNSLKLDGQIMGRKIDPDQQLLIVNAKNDVITTGKDKVFKKYKFPEEVLCDRVNGVVQYKMDLKMRVANQGPVDEQDGHELPATCLAVKDYLYSGARDGTIMIRSSERLQADIRMFKSHNIKSGGVSALQVSQKMKMIFSGGYDGDMFWWKGENIKGESDSVHLMKNNYSAPPDIGDQVDAEIKYYQQVLEMEYYEQQAPIREQQKKQTKDQLKSIQTKLMNLLQENMQADDLEKLQRDEFVIDLVAKENILEDGKKQQQVLRDKVRQENIKQEILYKLIKEKTWDQMEVQLKGINGLTQQVIVTNYHIRLRNADELRKLKLVREIRRQEIKEIKLRQTTNVKEIWSIEEKQYIINCKPGHPQMVLADYEKKEDPAPAKVAVAKPGAPQQLSKQLTMRGKGRQQQQQQQQQKQEEERKKKEEEEKEKEKEKQQQLQQQKQTEEKKEGEDLTEWDYLYSVSELFTTNRKRNQMILLSDIIFSIKNEFNKEFEQMMKLRHNQVDNINERNKRIAEINNELKKESQLYQPMKNILEDPEKVLTVTKNEIPFEQFETREMREKKEQERLKEEARLRALMADDAGIRAVKDMMGGTLEEKKETPLDEKLEMEEWMKKNPDDMTEDEKMKLKEFEVKKARLEEEKEKIRKNLEAELKKLNLEIVDICNRFDEKLLVLFRRKLEYDYRILEQELIIVRLALSIIMQQQAHIKINELQILHDGLIQKLESLKIMKDALDQMRDETQNQKKQLQDQLNSFVTGQRINYPQGFNQSNVKQLWQITFEEYKTNDKLKQESDEKLMANPKYHDILIVLDPYFENQKALLYRELEEQFESYLPALHERINNQSQGQENLEQIKEFFIQLFHSRFKLKQECEKQEKEYQDLDSFCKGFEQDYNQCEIQQQATETDQEGIKTMLEKSKSNIELMMRFKQGFVEISEDKPVPNLAEAVLMPRSAIEQKNDEIKTQGNKKIQLMEEIKKIKFDVAKSEYELKRRDLIIQDLECKTREVQLLKVKKEMQIALTKDDTRLNEKELSNLKDQIDQLKSTTESRLQTINRKKEKIEKDIEFIKKENAQLHGQGSVLSGNVKQLQEISDMQNKKNVRQGEESQEQQEDKFMKISRNHKLFQKAKQQAEEIEILRDELTKLKARTFANFSNANR